MQSARPCARWRGGRQAAVGKNVPMNALELVLLGAGAALLVVVVVRIARRATPGRGGTAATPRPPTDSDHLMIKGVSYLRCENLDRFLREALGGADVALVLPYVVHEEEHWEPGGRETVFSKLREALCERDSKASSVYLGPLYDPLRGRVGRFCSMCWRSRKKLQRMSTYANGIYCDRCSRQGMLYLYSGATAVNPYS